MDKKVIDWEKMLLEVQTPGKYLGTEWNSYTQKKGTKKFLLCFPDDYTIGMSSLGYHTVGNIIDKHSSFSCERCFAPAPDMEERMRKNSIGLFSLETKTAAKSFDIIGFSFHYELSYTNFLNMLDLAGLELLRKERKANDPLIIGGGPACVNPQILSEFLDLIVVGEAEPVLPELLEIFHSNPDKGKFLKIVAEMDGVYVPGRSGRVKLTVYSEFDNKFFPTGQPVAIVNIPHNRLNIEINRGCKNNCRFCQATVIYSPYRQKSPCQIMEAAKKSVASTGYDEIALTSLSPTDHPEVLRIMDDLHYAFRDLGVSVVMSSMRPRRFRGRLPDRLMRLKKGGLTFAPETPVQRLKKVINKDIRNEDIIEAANIAAMRGWDRIKLYFMVGIPGETMEDIQEIVELIKAVRKSSGLRVNATVSPLVPQPHTPFQWLEPHDPDSLAEKVRFIRKKASAGVKRFNSGQYIIESIMVRGDVMLSGVVRSAWKNGARFDQWDEYFKFDIWEKAFNENGLNWKDYYYRDFENMNELPWDVVDTGIEKDFLWRSYEKAMELAGIKKISDIK